VWCVCLAFGPGFVNSGFLEEIWNGGLCGGLGWARSVGGVWEMFKVVFEGGGRCWGWR
jgi:hypothetical protein